MPCHRFQKHTNTLTYRRLVQCMHYRYMNRRVNDLYTGRFNSRFHFILARISDINLRTPCSISCSILRSHLYSIKYNIESFLVKSTGCIAFVDWSRVTIYTELLWFILYNNYKKLYELFPKCQRIMNDKKS